MRFALIQHSHKGAHTRSYISAEIAKLAGHADVACLQELHDTLYFCQKEDESFFDSAGDFEENIAFYADLAKKHALVLVISLFERRAKGLYHNTAVVLEKTGEIAGKYRKMHIPDDPNFYEKFYFTPGDLGFTPIQTSAGRLGVLICWDQWFPEAARLMALSGAEVLIFPTAIGWSAHDTPAEKARQFEAWQTIQRAHAIANGIPVLSINRHGHEPGENGGINFWGQSFACDAMGQVLGKLATDADETQIFSLDFSETERVRRIWPFLRDRRIDAYDGILRRFLGA